MTITVTEATERPLSEEPFVMSCRSGEPPELRVTELQGRFTDLAIAEEYCMRVYGPGTYTVTFHGDHCHA